MLFWSIIILLISLAGIIGFFMAQQRMGLIMTIVGLFVAMIFLVLFLLEKTYCNTTIKNSELIMVCTENKKNGLTVTIPQGR